MSMKRWLAAGMSAAMVVGLLSGCGSSSAASTAVASPSASPSPSAAEEAGPAQQQNGKTLRGTVTAVDGDTVTIRTMGGDMGGWMPNASPAGEGALSASPEASAAPSQAPADAQTSATPGGNAGPDGQSQMPGGAQGRPSEGQPGQTSEEVTVTLSSDTKIRISKDGSTSDGALSEITVGCMVSITYGDDGETVTAVTVMEWSGEKTRGQPNGQAPSDAQATQTGG